MKKFITKKDMFYLSRLLLGLLIEAGHIKQIKSDNDGEFAFEVKPSGEKLLELIQVGALKTEEAREEA